MTGGRRYPGPPVRLDVFTQIPHAFAWMTEHAPVSTVLGRELEQLHKLAAAD